MSLCGTGSFAVSARPPLTSGVIRTPTPSVTHPAFRPFVFVLRLAARAAGPMRGLLTMLVLGMASLASASTTLELRDARSEIDAWPFVRVLEDPAARLSANDIMRRLAEFAIPSVPHANLGLRHGAVWLQVPLNVPVTESGRWLLEIDYPSLDRVDVHVVSDGRIVREVRLGDHLPFAQRPVKVRPHVVSLVLEPGMEHELLLRVQTTSSMIVPLRLIKQEALSLSEARFQWVQGIAMGLCLCLLAYSFAHGVQTRDPSFLYYGLSIAGITLFFLSYHGLGPQHLWGGSEWLTRNLSPLSVMPAVAGGLLFLDEVLDVPAFHARLSRAWRATAALAMVSGLAFALDLFSYETMHVVSTVLGPLPVVLGLPVAYMRARQGDRAAILILLGWGVYGAGIFTMAAFLRGYVPVNPWAEHAFQAGALVEMAMWLLVLGLRASDMRRRAERADRERESLMNLAHTDALTGLPNRRGLLRELEFALRRCTADKPLALFVLDLDGFKAVNDRMGHGVGDELLAAVARRLSAHVRAGDVVARLGGDEFVVLAHDLSTPAAAAMLGDKLLQAFAEPFTVQSRSCRVGGTIGYALAPQDAADALQLLALADAAMYGGKQAGKQRLRRNAAENQGVPA